MICIEMNENLTKFSIEKVAVSYLRTTSPLSKAFMRRTTKLASEHVKFFVSPFKDSFSSNLYWCAQIFVSVEDLSIEVNLQVVIFLSFLPICPFNLLFLHCVRLSAHSVSGLYIFAKFAVLFCADIFFLLETNFA